MTLYFPGVKFDAVFHVIQYLLKISLSVRVFTIAPSGEVVDAPLELYPLATTTLFGVYK